MKKTLVIHDIDPDGLLAAVIVGEYFEEKGYSVDYVRAVRYEEPRLDLMDEDTTVVIVDFHYNAERTRAVATKAKRVITLDHHKTALEELFNVRDDNIITLIEFNKAACRVAWDFCYPNENAPFQVDYVEDMDLWRWQLPHSKELNSYFSSVKNDIKSWQLILEESLDSLKEMGSAIWQYKEKTMSVLQKSKLLMKIGKYWVPAVNCADPSIVSYLGNRLAQNFPFAATFYLQASGKWKFSIRSITTPKNPKGIPVDKIAIQFGGGGHVNAAGFKLDKLPEFKIIGKDQR